MRHPICVTIVKLNGEFNLSVKIFDDEMVFEFLELGSTPRKDIADGIAQRWCGKYNIPVEYLVDGRLTEW